MRLPSLRTTMTGALHLRAAKSESAASMNSRTIGSSRAFNSAVAPRVRTLSSLVSSLAHTSGRP
jgi:hypothetical protein